MRVRRHQNGLCAESGTEQRSAPGIWADYEYDPNLEEFYDYERYGKLRMEKETGAFTEKGYVAYCGTLTLGELMAGGPAEQHQREQEFQMGGM